jgi:hypothetical protein
MAATTSTAVARRDDRRWRVLASIAGARAVLSFLAFGGAVWSPFVAVCVVVFVGGDLVGCVGTARGRTWGPWAVAVVSALGVLLEVRGLLYLASGRTGVWGVQAAVALVEAAIGAFAVTVARRRQPA